MQYMLLIYGDDKAWAKLPKEELEKVHGAFMQYAKELAEAGVMRAGSGLKPVSTATTVRMRNGKVVTTDGPFAETKEQLGGYFLIEVPNLDDAIKWAARCPGASYGGSIEVRPLIPN